MRNVHVKSMQTWIFGRSRNFQINRSFGVDRPASEVKVGVKVDPRKLATFGTKSCVGRWTVRIGTCVCVCVCVYVCLMCAVTLHLLQGLLNVFT